MPLASSSRMRCSTLRFACFPSSVPQGRQYRHVGVGLLPNVALYDVVAAAHRLVTAPDHPFGKRAGIPGLIADHASVAQSFDAVSWGRDAWSAVEQQGWSIAIASFWNK